MNQMLGCVLLSLKKKKKVLKIFSHHCLEKGYLWFYILQSVYQPISNMWLKQIYVQHWLDILVFLNCCPVLGRKCSLKTAKVGPKDKLFQVKAQRKWGSVVSDRAHQTALPQRCGTAAPSVSGNELFNPSVLCVK